MNANPTRQSLEQDAEARRLAALDVEKQTVLAQPHRRGDRSDMTDPLGVFVRFQWPQDKQDQARRCWEAGWKYVALVAKWRRVKGIPQTAWLEDETPSLGGEMDEKRIAEWGQEIRQCEEAMKCSGLPGFYAAQHLLLEGISPSEHVYGPVKLPVTQLAISLGFL